MKELLRTQLSLFIVSVAESELPVSISKAQGASKIKTATTITGTHLECLVYMMRVTGEFACITSTPY